MRPWRRMPRPRGPCVDVPMTERSVAVIGAGAAGLVTAWECRRAGHDVTVFEQSGRVGGLWVYEDRTESDPLGQTPAERIHGSLYASLRTNLPRDLMAFEGYTFDSAGGGHDAWPRYPGHAQVLEYLERFAADGDLLPCIRFGRPVASVRSEGEGWRVDEEAFDAVAVCNGHFHEPLVPDLPGLATFRGLALHSHNYRRPGPFQDMRVVVLGSSVSGAELAGALAKVARTVHFSGRAFPGTQPAARSRRIRRCPPVVRVLPGAVVLANGERVDDVDAILFCTGYHYRFPFLPPALARVRNNSVWGLYRQLVSIERPTLAFVGLPFRIVPFPFFQRQARWFARLLAREFPLPDRAERRRDHAAEIRALRRAGVAERHFHRMEDRQFAYLDQLARQCGDARVPDWFRELWFEHKANTVARPGAFHDLPLPAWGPTVVPGGDG